MNAKEKMIEYAKKHNDEKIYTHEQWLGKMIQTGIVIDRTPMTMTIANARREGKTIIITETIKEEQVDRSEIETTTEVLRIEL